MPSEIQPKPFYLSLSFWGLVVGAITPLLVKVGVVVDPTILAAALVEIITAVLGLVGAVMGLRGILRRKDIKVLPTK